MSLQTQQLGLCRNHGPIFGKENSNRFEAKNSKNMELIKNLEEKKKSWTLWGGAPNQDSLRIMFFVCFVVFVFLFFFCVCDFCFSKVFEVFHSSAGIWQLRPNPLEPWTFRSAGPSECSTSWIIKLFVWQNCTLVACRSAIFPALKVYI